MSEQCRVITEEQWQDYLKKIEMLSEAEAIIKTLKDARSPIVDEYVKKWRLE